MPTFVASVPNAYRLKNRLRFLAETSYNVDDARLQQAAVQAVPGATVRTGRPEAPAAGADDPVIDLFLYQVTPNAALRVKVALPALLGCPILSSRVLGLAAPAYPPRWKNVHRPRNEMSK